jgi:hypothetical protein
MQHIQHLSFESLVKMDHFSKRAIAKEGCLMRCHHDGISSACGCTAHRVSFETWSSQFASDRDPSQLSLKADLIALLSCYSGPLTHHKLEAPGENGRHG